MKTMKNKWIFIGISVIFIMVVGVIVFLHFTAPEILTKTPLELITGRVIQNGAKDTVSTPTRPVSVPPNFIVPDEVWKSASHLLSTEGKELRGGVQFTEVPIGMKLYAPVDGWHVSIGEMLFEGASFMGVTLTPNPNPEGDRALWLIARWIEVTNFNPKKGEAFAEIREALPFPSHFDRRGVLVVSVDAIWGEQSDQTITDPRIYLKTAIENTN